MTLVSDLRFADDSLLFANAAANAAFHLDVICGALGTVGLMLNSTKTKVLTSEAQAPFHLTTQGGLVVEILRRDEVMKLTHGWDV